MTIQFGQVPGNLRVPFVAVEFDSSQAVTGLAVKPYRALLIGQRLSSGTVAELVPTRVYSASDMASQFGKGSQLYEIGVAWFANNKFTEVWAVALDDEGAGAQSTRTATFTGPATQNGTVFLYIAGKRLQVAVADGATATQIAAAVVTAVTADTLLPVTAGNVAGVVTFTARHKGTIGNLIDVRLNYNPGEALPLGVSCTIGAASGGTTTPSLDDVWPVLGEVQYDVIALPYFDTTSLASVDAFLAERWGPTNPLEGVAIAGARGNMGVLQALGSGENSKHTSLMGAELSPSSPWSWSGALAGQVALSAAADPSLHFRTLPLKGIYAPANANLFDLAERNLLLFDGISTFNVDPAGNVRIERVITTYQQNELGAEDPSFLDLTTPLLAGMLRWSLRNYADLRWARQKLASDGSTLGAAANVSTPDSLRLELIALATQWIAAGWIEDLEGFKANLVVERNGVDPNRVDVLLPPDFINSLMVTAVKMEFRL